MGLGLLIFVGILVLGLVPLIGTVAVQILLQVMVGGMLWVCARSARGERFRFRDFFEGFRRHTGNLAMIGLLYVLALVAAFMVLMLGFGGGLISRLFYGEAVADGVFAAGLGAAALTFMGIWMVLLLTLWFAPALVIFAGRPPLEAMQLSFRASLRNLGAMLLLGLILSVVLFLGFGLFPLLVVALVPSPVLPVLLGIEPIALWLLLLPLISGAAYASFEDIFGGRVAITEPLV